MKLIQEIDNRQNSSKPSSRRTIDDIIASGEPEINEILAGRQIEFNKIEQNAKSEISRILNFDSNDKSVRRGQPANEYEPIYSTLRGITIEFKPQSENAID
jgi:hypothetical protein